MSVRKLSGVLIVIGISFVALTSHVSADTQENESQISQQRETPSPKNFYRKTAKTARDRTAGTEDQLTLIPLAPATTKGRTMYEQPNLYWYISKNTTDQIKLTVSVLDDNIDEDEYDGPIAMSNPPEEVQSIKLADYDVTLQAAEEKDYEWAIALPEKRILAQALITRVPVPDGLQAQLQQATPEERVRLYDDNGLWYDAFDAITKLIQKDPHNTMFLGLRAKLLHDVGLSLKDNVVSEVVN